MLGFLFVEEDEFGRDADDVAKVLNDDGQAVVRAAHRGARGPRRRGPPRRSRRRSAPSSSTRWGSSRATRSGRSGSPSPAAGSRRRCSSPWSCSAASAACPGSRARSDERRPGRAATAATATARRARLPAAGLRHARLPATAVRRAGQPPPPRLRATRHGQPAHPAPGQPPAQPPAAVPPLEYHLILRGGRRGWWRTVGRRRVAGVGSIRRRSVRWCRSRSSSGSPPPARTWPTPFDADGRPRQPDADRAGLPQPRCSPRRSRSPGC